MSERGQNGSRSGGSAKAGRERAKRPPQGLRRLVYVAPAIVASFFITPASAVSPTSCNPNGGPCQPSLTPCTPNG